MSRYKKGEKCKQLKEKKRKRIIIVNNLSCALCVYPYSASCPNIPGIGFSPSYDCDKDKWKRMDGWNNIH